MFKEISGKWFICHVRFGPNLDEPFPSQEAARLALEAMKPVDRMLATGLSPFLRTDSVFMEGTENGRQFQDTPKLGDQYREKCIANGGNPVGKKYMHQLAKFPGDPRAWVSGRGDVQKICEERKMGCEGMVNVKTPEAEPVDRVKMAKDLVEREVKKMTRGIKKPLDKSVKEELKEAIQHNYGPST